MTNYTISVHPVKTGFILWICRTVALKKCAGWQEGAPVIIELKAY
jgi:hypothetical protein